MSTKTTFKRIALVTVAALSFGTMAAVPPASAAATTLTTVTVSDTTVYGFVGETLTAGVKVTAVGAADAALTAEDSITLTAKLSSITASNVTFLNVDSVNSESSTSGYQLALNKFGFEESSTAGVPVAGITVATGKTSVLLEGLDTKTANVAALLNFAPSTPGTYKIAVTPSNVQAGGSVIHTPGVITFVVLSAGAASGDGGVLTPFNAAGGVAGAGNYNQVKVTGQLGSTALGTRIVVTGSTIEAAITDSTLSIDKTTLTIPGKTTGTPTQGLINVLTPTVGTVTVNSYRETAVGTYSATADSTVTITARATALNGVYNYSEAYMAADNATPTAITDAALAITPTTEAAISVGTQAARILVTQYDVLENALATTNTKAVTVEISGAGRVSTTAGGAAAASSIVAVAAASANGQTFAVWPDGRSGVGTVVVKVNGGVVLTRTLSFTGVASQLKLVAATATAPNPTKSYLAVGGTMTISVLPYDANNIKMTAVDVLATSGTATVAAVSSATQSGGVVTVTGVAVGKSDITICVGACATATIKLVVPVEVTLKTGKAVLAFDKASAQPGEKVTWTITATDANGRPTADGTSVALFSSITANMSVSGGTLPTGTETLTAGKATGYFFAPTAGSGTLTLTATQGASHDTYIAGVKAATAAGTTYTALKDEVSLTIASDATAAAEEALAAASDAFDAALTAAEAAEMAQSIAQEALDSVASLRKRMNKRFNAIEKLIKRLL